MAQYGIQNISTLDVINIIETDDTGSIILESGYQLYSGSLSMWSESFENYAQTYPSFTGSFTGSFNDYSGSLGWLDNFASSSRTGSFTGSFTGSLNGSSSYAYTSSYSTYTSNIKSGVISSAEWAVDMTFNYTASVNFSSSYTTTGYAISLTAVSDARAFTITNKRTNGFNVNSNSGTPMTDDVFWIAVPYNNP